MSKNETGRPQSLTIERIIPAPPDRVFDAWTDPSELQKWWGPEGVRCLAAEVDLRVGGRYRIGNELPDGSVIWIAGEFETIERPNLLVYTWTVESRPQAVERVSVRFALHGQETRLILRHTRISDAQLRDQHERGWLGCIDGLLAFLAGLKRLESRGVSNRAKTSMRRR